MSLRTDVQNIERIRQRVQSVLPPLLDEVRRCGYPDATVEDLALFLRLSSDAPAANKAAAGTSKAKTTVKAKRAAKSAPRSNNNGGPTLRQVITKAAAGLDTDAFSAAEIIAAVQAEHPDANTGSIKRTLVEMGGSELERVDRGRYRLSKETTAPDQQEAAAEGTEAISS